MEKPTITESSEIKNTAEEKNLKEAAVTKDNKKKKKNPVLRFFINIFILILVLLIAIIAALSYCALDSKSSLSSIPRSYSLYLHTDSAFDAFNPLFDLQAADMLLSEPQFKSLRKPFMDFRSSPARDNKFLRFAASRPVDIALYGQGSSSHYVVSVNLGFFSAISRLGQLIFPKLNYEIENLSYEKNEQTSYFCYKMKDSILYFKSVKNLIIASDSLEHLLTAALVENDSNYTEEQRKLFKTKSKKEFRIVADAQSLLLQATEGNPLLRSLSSIISADSLSAISFTIDDSDLSLKCALPLAQSEEELASLAAIFKKPSSVPNLLTRFSEITQYYTLLNLGSLEELKNSLLPFIPEVKNPDDFWENSNDWCKSILKMSLEDLLFSWSGSELAVLGVENQNDPIFAIQIKDEKQRQKIFNQLTDSILIKDDNSLILGGVRLPRLQLPTFLNWMLSIFKINLPNPYFLVLDGNIYFSESAECLSAIYTNAQSGKPLVKNKNYTALSKGQRKESSLSLFYNLERSIPFFLRSNEIFSKVLQLYSQGRFDMYINQNLMEFSLHACARSSGSLYSVPGFPINLEGKADPLNLQCDSEKNPKNLFWLEENSGHFTIKALNLSSMTIISKSESDFLYLSRAEKEKNKGLLWTVSSHGVVSLLNEKLENTENFPIMLGENISVRPTSMGDKLVLVSENKNVHIIKSDASISSILIPDLTAKSEVAVLKGKEDFVLYSKGFMGKIYYFSEDKCLNQDNPFIVPGIAFGSPALLKSSGKTLIGFVTQAGEMNVWQSDSSNSMQLSPFPMQLGGVFMTNVASSQKYFYALSSDAVLYRISTDGSILTVQIPNSRAKNPYLCVRDMGNGGRGIFVCADANVIYGFNENLELLSGYPLTGWGKPVFADVNSDKIAECIALTLDGRLVAWKTR